MRRDLVLISEMIDAAEQALVTLNIKNFPMFADLQPPFLL